MSNEKFITVKYLLATKTIAISQISSIEPFVMGTKITLKEVINGENVSFTTTDTYNAILQTIDRLNSK